MTSTLPEPHASFLQALAERLARDHRFDALLAGGSIVHGGFDAYSDLDLVLVVNQQAYREVMIDRRQIAKQFGDMLAAFTGEHVGEPRLLICLYGPELLHVDLKFVRLADLTELVERPLVVWARNTGALSAALDKAVIEWPNRPPDWFEERSWIWLHYGAVKLQRGELFEAMGMIAFFRDQVLGPLLHRRLGQPQRGVRKIERIGTAAERLKSVVAHHDPGSIARALKNAMLLYIDLRSDQPPEVLTPGMPELLMPLLADSYGRMRGGQEALTPFPPALPAANRD